MKLIVRLGQGRTPMSNHGMNNEVIISCAVTGAGDTVGKHPAIPVTPRQIADAAIEAAKAGAAIAHLHVRNVETGKAGRDLANYREAVQLVRESGTDVVINLTAGMGGDFVYDPSNPSVAGSGSDMIDAAARLAHVEDTRPEICTLDCGSLNFGNGAYIATADLLRDMAARIQKMGVKPEIEAFEYLAGQAVNRRGPHRQPATFPDLSRYSVGRGGNNRSDVDHAQPSASRLQLGRLCHRPQPDGVCCPIHVAGW